MTAPAPRRGQDAVRDEGAAAGGVRSIGRRLGAGVLPHSQRRTVDEIAADLDPSVGDVAAKTSAFWTLLVLAAVIACAGVVGNSTATVIGAMIIAPLSTPIMGSALAVVTGRHRGAVRRVLLGIVVVVAIGVVFALVLPSSSRLLQNPQVTARTSPGILDLLVAAATGLAGAIGIVRRDVSAVLPGVAIAISLVPPLTVVGLCLGSGDLLAATGALLLFASNLLALVLTGIVVFGALGYSRAPDPGASRRRRTRVLLGSLTVLVVLPLAVHTALTLVVGTVSGRVETAARAWVAAVRGAEVTGVDLEAAVFVVRVRTPAGVPPVLDLRRRLRAALPASVPVVVETTVGERIEVLP